jgi:hypothetical protein
VTAGCALDGPACKEDRIDVDIVVFVVVVVVVVD